MTWYTDNVEKYMPIDGYQIVWPRVGGFAQRGDLVPEMNTVPAFEGHMVEAFTNGEAYLNRLMVEMDNLIANPTEGIFWIHGWYFQLFDHGSVLRFYNYAELPVAFQNTEPTTAIQQYWELFHDGDDLTISGVNFYDKLEALENAGVDVRVIGFLPPILVKSHTVLQGTEQIEDVDVGGQIYEYPSGIAERNISTLYNLLRLRQNYLTASKVIFNVLSHPLGGAHAKFVICGNNSYLRAFTGGVDLAPSRYAPEWSDATVLMEGKAATKAAEFFKLLWNEISATNEVEIHFEALDHASQNEELAQKKYRSHYSVAMNTNIADKPVSNLAAADFRVQMYRTVPRKNYTGVEPWVKRKALGYTLANKLGIKLLEGVDLANAMVSLPYIWTPPISFANNGLFEFKTVCYKAIMSAENYIFIMDQDASNFELMTCINRRLKERRAENQPLKVIILTDFVDEVDMESHEKQVKMHEKLAAGIPKDEQETYFAWAQCNTHAKVVLIDDKWVSIGSANCMRRSFYTDIEMGVGIMHETWVRDFRKTLWATFCVQPLAHPIPNDMNEAIGLWRMKWKLAVGHNYNLPSIDVDEIPLISLPNKDKHDGTFNEKMNALEDPDSNAAI